MAMRMDSSAMSTLLEGIAAGCSLFYPLSFFSRSHCGNLIREAGSAYEYHLTAASQPNLSGGLIIDVYNDP